MRFALIRDGVVENVVEAEENFPSGHSPTDGGVIALPAQNAGPGWIYDGETFSPPDVVASAPESVTMFQAREILRRTPAKNGGTLLDAVNAYIDSQRAEQPTLALAWEYATHVERNGVFVKALAGVFDLSEAALDELFRVAATIDA
ncbi:hypothetical protein LG047_05055 [Methylocystis sp. WRRC1]|uniref:hypothetical protein n=1 Tax=unclassified Methylocystis TaxID=2625913 RepID=UPI0001F88296|nr:MULTISPECIES: hypothetical protein [unclassified Methylocystis]MCC3244693.1 hypothetical protein [Methylocystis sp. WRRC1]